MAEVLGQRSAASERFVTFTFGTFHTVIFIVSAVLVLHLTDALVGLLTGLNTLTGLALFAALWATTTWSTGRAIRGVGGPILATRTPVGAVVTRAARSGGLNGVLFLAAAAVILAVSALLTGQGDSIGVFILGGLFVVLVGILAGVTIGAILGVVFAAIDLVHIWAVGRLVGTSTQPQA
ncbi:MAG: hypothetical protein E6I37_06290 [Chloroflexi bacterium]|nr:MAG: hypothetical protein E6I37_06290 [Chloroflexota bacterium]